jgi:SAM-dependent methyltransferase
MRPPEFDALVEAAAALYLPAGRSFLHFARGKLRHDPVFAALLQRGLLPDNARVLDLGCGQAVLIALLLAAHDEYLAGRWPQGWPPPPAGLKLHGVDLRANAVRAGQIAFGQRAKLEALDLRHARLPKSDVVVIFDVLHYMNFDAQRRLLTQVREALPPNGVFLLRAGDASAGFSFWVTRVADQIITMARGQLWPRFYCRTREGWLGLLRETGFEARVEPMSEGTPFANVLLQARPSTDIAPAAAA